MFLLKYFVFCMLLAFVMASVWKRKFEDAIVIGQFWIITSLFLCYVLDILYIGFYIVCLLIVVGSVFGCYYVIKKRNVKEVIRLCIRPSTIVYFALLCMIYYTVRANKVALIDELHLWAALPKILVFQHGHMQLQNSFMLAYSDYIPGMPLYLYFLERLNRCFTEPILYFGYVALGGAMLLKVLSKWDNFKKWYLLPIVAVILYLVPLTFYNNLYNDHAIYYMSLHVDPILGITVGFTTWLALQNPWTKLSSMIQFSLSLIFLTLLKSSGIVFSLILIIFTIVFIYKYDKDSLKRKYIWICSIGPLVFYSIWKVCLSFFKTADSVGYSMSDIFSSKYIISFLKALLFDCILIPKNAALSKYCTFATCLLWLISIAVLVYVIKSRADKGQSKLLKFGMILMSIETLIFIIGLYGLYAGPFKGNTYSFGRYLGTILTSWLCFLVFIIFDNFSLVQLQKETAKFKIFLAFSFFVEAMVIITIYPFYKPGSIQYPQIALQDADKTDTILGTSVNNEGKSSKNAILVIDPEYDSFSPDLHVYFHRRLYFDMIDHGINLSQWVFANNVVYDSEKKTLKVTGNYEKTKINYVYWVHYKSDSLKYVEMFQVVDDKADVLSLKQVIPLKEIK